MQPSNPVQAPAKGANETPLGVLLTSLSVALVTTAGISGGVAALALGASTASLAAAAAVTAVVVGQVAAAVGVANATTYLAHLFFPAPPIYSSHFDNVLAAGTGLLDACLATQTANSSSIINTLRLVSKAASKIALHGITGYNIQLAHHGSFRCFGDLGAVKHLLRSAKVTRLTITAPQREECPSVPLCYSGTQHAQGRELNMFDSLAYQVAHVNVLVARYFGSVTHLKLVAGGFSSGHHSRAESMAIFRLAASFRKLQELSIDTDIGVDMLRNYRSLCPRLTSLIVQDVDTLPFSTMRIMHSLMPNVTRHTVICTYGDPGVLSEYINSVCYPTTFDLCGRTLSLTSTLHITKEGVTLQNGTFVVMEKEDQHDSLTAIQVHDCSVLLRDILLCDSSSKHGSWAGIDKDDSRSSMAGHPPTRWKGFHLNNTGSVTLQRCEIRGARAAIDISTDVAVFEFPILNCTLKCEHVIIHCGSSGGAHVSGLRVQGSCCSALLRNCLFINGGASTISIEEGAQLTATQVSVWSNSGHALSVTDSSVANLIACKVSGRSPQNVFVSGLNSVLYVLGCKLNGPAHTEDGGSIHVLY